MTNKIFKTFITVLIVSVLPFSLSASTDENKFRVDKIEIHGNKKTKDYIILREMIIKIGDTVTDEQIEIDRKRIQNLGIFERVQIKKETVNNTNILKIYVTERWYIFPVPIFDMERRDVDKITYGLAVLNNNFRGRAEQLIFSVEGGYKPGVYLHYRNPWFADKLKLFNYTKIYYQEEKSKSTDIEQYEEKKRGIETLIGKRFGLFTYTGIKLIFKDISVTGDIEDKVISKEGRDRLFYLEYYISYDNRDLREYPTLGWKSYFNIKNLMWSNPDFNFLKLTLDITRFNSLFDDKVIIGIRNYLNYTFGNIARYNQSYFGYIYKLRGHFFDVYEGEKLFGGSIEIRIPFGKPKYYTWENAPFAKEFFRDFEFAAGMHLFCDYGKPWYNEDSFSFNIPYYGFGFGFHFRLPYDTLLRMDLAYNGNNFQFLFDRSFLF